MSYDRIPACIRSFAQWINWRYETITDKNGDKKETKIPVRPVDGHNASVTNPLDWTDFYTACDSARNRGVGLGFVFTKSDPYTGTDLDNPNGDIGTLERQQGILQSLNSYAELSPSGTGLHIITRAVLPGTGRRRNKVECYDALRFFTFTGNVFYDAPICDRQAETLAVYETIGDAVIEAVSTGFEAEAYTDTEICNKAASAHNGDKFKRLWEGDWQTDYGRQSQSEADFALINIISFYSRNLPQTGRVFRQSALGQRQKAKRGDYVTKMVKRSFDRLPPQITIAADTGAWSFDATAIEPWNPKISLAISLPTYEPQVWDGPTQVVVHIPVYKPLTFSYADNDPGRPLNFPPPKPPPQIPGLVGQLVQQAWEAAPHQIAEVAVASALSAMSLLSARTYRHGTLGLSLYLLVLAQTSTGKSFGFKANDAWHNALVKFYGNMKPPHSQQGKARAELLEQMVIGEIGSAQGLAQHMPKSPSTLFHADEWVDTIREMARPNPTPHIAQLKSELLRLMEMAGPGRVYRGRKYSNRSSTAQESVNVFMASLSILATGTPGAFYNDMSEGLLTSGFLPRFTILEYEGGLTKRNENVRRGLDPEMMEGLMRLFDKSFEIGLILNGDDEPVIDVQPKDATAAARLEWFDNVCYREIETANNTGLPTAGMWSRAKEHVRQIASLIAVGCNPYLPAIELSHVDIAIGIVRPTLDKISAKVGKGETGIGDDRLEAEVRKIIVRMMTRGVAHPQLKQELLDQGYLQLAIVKNICVKTSPFRTHKMGANNAFESAIMSMAKYGVIKLADVNGLKCCQPNVEHFQ